MMRSANAISRSYPATAAASGFSLLECLFAILIVSVGVVGLLGLQSTATISMSNAKLRSDAALLANDAIALIRIDSANLLRYKLNDSAADCSAGASKSPNAVVEDWLLKISTKLPGTRRYLQHIRIEPTNLVTVIVCWKEPQDAEPHNHVAYAQIF